MLHLVNPKVRIIVKYPCWYDDFHERGYDVIRETADFDRIWVDTETRDYLGQWGGTPQYARYFPRNTTFAKRCFSKLPRASMIG